MKLKYSNGKPRKPIKQFSDKPHAKAKRNKLKLAKIEVAERSGGQCERIIVVGGKEFAEDVYRCPNVATDFHHVLARSQGGEHTKENLKHLCRGHHSLCKDKPNQAIAQGLVIPYKGYKHE